ncbi:phosphoribosylamine--glycine ligase [Spirochaetia bacterium 38H-sp]|uniref:Phosphoribosylamine--glycine ligase n=1 Tax=Rarispira pelagica TaxID=3141764 RepID=A0ABU9UDY3_9SPIR
MKMMIIGSGGREHALAWKCAQSPKIQKIYCCPGNGGTATLEKAENIDISDYQKMADFAKEEGVELVMVGPEAPLVEGISDIFQKERIPIIGPVKEAAMLEGSKAFAKEFMKKYNVATADYIITDSYDKAMDFVRTANYPLVIKADGLAAGKGVRIIDNRQDAERTIKEYMIEKIFGDAGTKIVIEEYLTGIEASILSITDGSTIIPFISAQDHKPIGEGNTGDNTGGMGVIAPNPAVDKKVMADFTENIMKPTLEGIKKEGWDFRGIIFFGIMITKKGAKLLEYNVRFGDPETQALLPMLKTDLIDILTACWEKKLHTIELQWNAQHSCCVVAASGGYPGSYKKGYPIEGLEKTKNTIFIAGAKKEGEKLITSGGRVLAVCATGSTREEARKKAYSDMQKIHFTDIYYRKDIGTILPKTSQ